MTGDEEVTRATRKCPECGVSLSYGRPIDRDHAEQRGTLCKTCAFRKLPGRSLLGKTFGKLTVIREGKSSQKARLWVCRCSCGKELAVASRLLNSGNTRSCGCLRMDHSNVPDLTGKLFGYLTVLHRVENSKFGNACWLCRCVCGREITLSTNVLHQGKRPTLGQVSCGCHKARMRVHPFQYVLGMYKGSAKKRGFKFSLPIDLFRTLLDSRCDYCGTPPSLKLNRGMMQRFEAHADYRYNGIDRVDSSKGYIPGNVVPCCATCNRMKLNHPYDFFIAQIKRILAHYEQKAGVHSLKSAA